MTRGRYYSSVMPVAGVIYVIAWFATGFDATVAIVGTLVFALIVMVGSAIFRAQAADASASATGTAANSIRRAIPSGQWPGDGATYGTGMIRGLSSNAAGACAKRSDIPKGLAFSLRSTARQADWGTCTAWRQGLWVPHSRPGGVLARLP